MEKIINEFIDYKDDNNNTRMSYKSDLMLFLNYLKFKEIRNLYKVKANDIEDFYTSVFLINYERVYYKKGLVTKKIKGIRSESSKSRVLSTLSSFYKYLVFKEKVKSSPVPKRSTTNNVKSQNLSTIELKIILDFIKREDFSKNPKRDRSIIEILFYCGLRVSELIGITMADLKLKAASPFIFIQGKGSRLREAPIPDNIIKNLFDYINTERKELVGKEINTDFLFISNYRIIKNGKPSSLSRNQINNILTKISRTSLGEQNLSNTKSGLKKYTKISPHMLRHSIGTHLHRSGKTISQVRDHLGHSTAETTSRYIGKQKEKMKILEKFGPLTGKV